MSLTGTQEWLDWREQEDDRLYERFGKPLENDHWGELVAIGPDGTILFAGLRRYGELAKEGIDDFGSGNFAITRIGERVTGEWLSL